MDLFAPTQLQVVPGDGGGVRYWPGFSARADADAWFAALLSGADWSAQRRRMYDRTIDVPRLTSTYRTNALPDALPLAAILMQVQACVPAPYNAVGLNLYRDGHDSVAMHNDKLHSLVPGEPIALVSLGDTRRMAIRAKTGERQRIAIDLEHGSLLVMSHASQLSHEHGIAKTARLLDPRMSIVFRVRPAAWPPD